jgi:hypothetical protein
MPLQEHTLTTTAPASNPAAVPEPVFSPYHAKPNALANLAVVVIDDAQCRILLSLSHHPDGCCLKRTLQQSLSKVPADALNPAIDTLGFLRLVNRDGDWLILPVDVREAVITSGLAAVRRRRAARERALTRQRHQGRARNDWRSRHKSRPLPDRRRDPHGWGHSMLARRGGLAVQQLYRRTGRHPTEAATRARQARRQRFKQAAAAAAPLPIRMAVAGPPPATQARAMLEGRYRQARPTTATSLPTATPDPIRPLPSRPTQIVDRNGETRDEAPWAPTHAHVAPPEPTLPTLSTGNEAHVPAIVDLGATLPRRRPVSDCASFGRSRR